MQGTEHEVGVDAGDAPHAGNSFHQPDVSTTTRAEGAEAPVQESAKKPRRDWSVLLQEAIQFAREKGKIDLEMLCTQFELNEPQAYALRKKMREAGVIEKLDAGKHWTYVEKHGNDKFEASWNPSSARRPQGGDVGLEQKLEFVNRLRQLFGEAQGEVLDSLEKDIKLASDMRTRVFAE